MHRPAHQHRRLRFGDCYERRLTVEFDGLPLHFISLDDFKVNKRSTGRLKDLADLESLGETPPHSKRS